jgi:hypothetical protein
MRERPTDLVVIYRHGLVHVVANQLAFAVSQLLLLCGFVFDLLLLFLQLSFLLQEVVCILFCLVA